MKYRKIVFLVSVLLYISSNIIADERSSSGLYFSSHEVNKDQRTSLHLTPKKSLHLTKAFSLQFNAKFRKGDGYYGYICKIIANDNINIDLVSNTGTPNTNFWLVYKDKIICSFSLNEILENDIEEWMAIKLSIDLKQSTISLSFNDITKTNTIEDLFKLKKFDITFGAFSNSKFQNTDVAPMTLNNIIIKDCNDRIFRHWKLSSHAINKVYDEITGAEARVYNGIWLIDEHIKWKNIQAFKVDDLMGIAKNENEGLIYLLAKEKLLVYTVATADIDTIYYSKGYPFSNYYNYFIYHPIKKTIISYDFTQNYLNEFDFQTKEWINNSYKYIEPDHSHHNAVISPIDGTLYTFGGYGHYTYKNTFFTFDTVHSKWHKENLSTELYPRYLSASGLMQDKWLIFGGYGSKTGRQEVAPMFFYDLFSYDLTSKKITKLQEFKKIDSSFVPCEDLVVTPDDSSFYTLIYNPSSFQTHLHLTKFNIQESTYATYSNAIPYRFSDVDSWCVFFLHKNISKLITVTNYKDEVQIYSLAYPALHTADAFQVKSLKHTLLRLSVFLILLIIIVGLPLVIWMIVKRKKQTLNIKKMYDNSDETSHIITESKTISSIYFLGGFQIFNKDGDDISASFTPTLKQLFVLMQLYTVKNGRGVSINRLNDILWFDKSENSARNNRNVSISKLRSLMEQVGQIDFIQEGSYWKVDFDEVYSDYVEIETLCEKLQHSKLNVSKEDIVNFIQIVDRGDLLPDIQEVWLDDFKANFSNRVLDTLSDFLNLSTVKNDLFLQSSIAECILKYDITNEDAIALKCSILYKHGKKGLAKASYDSFVREYKNMLGVEYPVQFVDLIKNVM